MRRLLYYSLLCLLWISVDSCKDDEVAAPPKPSFTVDKTSGLYNVTEFTFTIDQVSANSISLLPYGAENANFEGIIVPASSFTNGKATVKFTYAKVGTFNAVVVANNHTKDGESIKNELSDSKAITITSDATAISEFTVKNSTSVTIKDKVDADGDSILVTVPYGTDLTKLDIKYTASDFATVTASGSDFSAPVDYVVKAQNGSASSTYTVYVTVTPVEKKNSFKSFSAILASTAGGNKALLASVDSVGKQIVIYDTLGAPTAPFDSVALKYELYGKFAYVRYANGIKVHSGDTLDLTSVKQFSVVPQDSTGTDIVTYNVYTTNRAPKLVVSFNTLNPVVTGANKNFDITLNVLKGTDISAIPTTIDYTVGLPLGVLVTDVTVTEDGVTSPFLTLGQLVDYTKPVKFTLSVKDGILKYKVVYTATVNVLK